MTAAGNVAAHRAERAHKLAGGEAGDGFAAEGCGELRNGEGANLLSGGGESLTQCRVKGLKCRGHFLPGDAPSGCAFEAIELGRVTQKGAVALFAYISHDAPDGGQYGVEGRAAALFEGSEDFFCLSCASSFCPYQLHHCLWRNVNSKQVDLVL
jgi:hypothetical protein